VSHLSVVTWNAEGMFVDGTKTKRANPHDALRVLRELDADIIVIPEFGNLAGLRDEIRTTIQSLGYQIASSMYHDARVPGLGFVILSRLPIIAEHTHSLAVTGRTFLELLCKDPQDNCLRIIGVHLDDRGEAIRMKQVGDVVSIINQDNTTPTLLVGDMNAMHETSRLASFVRSKLARSIVRRVKHEQIARVASAVQDMAMGTTIAYILKETTLHDLDTKNRRTISGKQRGLEWIPAVRLAKIDWIFGSKQFRTLSYRIMRDVGSDHRPVLAKIQY
jgi:endonuclease/exonuclease/phosphatase family metal-dependent hydrolase